MIRAFPEGFSPALPTLLIVLLICISLFIGWWSYKDLKDKSGYTRPLLISLRSLSLLILCLLLLNPFINRERTISSVEEVAVFIDNSSSIGVERGTYQGAADFSSAYESFVQNRPEDIAYPEFQFGESLREAVTPDFTDPSTNIQQVMGYLLENENRFSAAVIFTDGIATRGRNPVYQAQDLAIPIITIPLGDTTTVRDLVVSDIDYADPVYTNTTNRITAEIRHRGYEGEETDIVLLENGIPADRKTVRFPSSSGTEWVDFDRVYTEEGFVNMSISAEPLDEEFTEENNRSSAAFRVLDNKTRILSIAYEIYPDVASVRRLIASDRQYELLQSTYLGNGRYTGEQLPNLNPDEIDLLVIHGLPSREDDELMRLLNSDTSVLFFMSPGGLSTSVINQVSGLRLYNYRGSANNIPLVPEPDTSAISHPVLELNPVRWDRLPSLTAKMGSYQPVPGANVLLTGEFSQQNTGIPLLLVADYGNKRVASVNSFGWSRYELSTQPEATGIFTDLVNNLVSWSSSASEERLLKLDPLRNTFTEREQVRMRASLTNERGERETNASVNMILSRLDEDMPPISFQMRHVGEGIYELTAGRYPSGVYSASGVAVLGDREIDRDETQFTISSVNEELTDTRRNSGLLLQLADVTGGFTEDDPGSEKLSKFLEELAGQRNPFDTVTETDYMYRNSIWFFGVLLLLTAEWLLRRRISLP